MNLQSRMDYSSADLSSEADGPQRTLYSDEYVQKGGRDDYADIVVPDSLESDDGQSDLESRNDEGREPPGGPGGGDNAAAGFWDVSRGPLGAAGIVNNRLFVLAQIRERKDLLRSIQADDRQASVADEDARTTTASTGYPRPQKYKDLIGQDVRLLAQKALPPSQDVTVLRKELASARADVQAKSHDVIGLEGTVSELRSNQAKRALEQDRLETKIRNLRSRYEAASDRLGNRIQEEEQKKFQYKHKLKEHTEKCERLNILVVDWEEENGRLTALARDAWRSEQQKDATIKQLDESIKAFKAVEEGSRPALDVLKESVDLLREQKRSAESMHEKMVAVLLEALRTTKEELTYIRQVCKYQLKELGTMKEELIGLRQLSESQPKDLSNIGQDF
ncbi:hypothetical protein DHEL01_v207557 [Diaporthe helianthi]|uniref:Uncharacterized protein n=1 Tax=Diaporthe helianthi TaxID=158607 RepID=A0A2P5HUW8_DIAHE|nr:hypothetical protein DHEL01_v207557 [Diaporthe helianthi]